MAPDSESQRRSLVLADFVPFRLNRLADAVSHHLAEIYQEGFGLEISEWRVLVTAGQGSGCSAQEVVLSTRMHKTRVSRAVAVLEARHLIKRQATPDGRRLTLHLTAAGKTMYFKLVPLALNRERNLLSCLSDLQRDAFLGAISHLEEHLGLNSEE